MDLFCVLEDTRELTYKQSIPVGAKAETTIKTEELHIANLLRAYAQTVGYPAKG